MSQDTLDLKTIGGSAGVSAPDVPVHPPKESPYNPARDRETVRGTLAKALVWTLIVIVGLLALAGIGITGYCAGKEPACSPETVELKSLGVIATLVVTPLVGLVGAVVGFYFGEKAGQS